MTEQNRRKDYTISTWVPADHTPAPITVRPDNALLPIAGEIVQHGSHTGHARQDDDAITHAKATLLISAAYIVAAAMITTGLLLIVWLFRGLGDGWATYAYTGLIVWGVACLLALWGNRRQALHHTPSGIAHHELDVRERVARHAIDTHADLLIRQWEIERDRKR